MARVTVEDCLRNVKNRFELVMIAAKRARQLMRGKDPKVEWDNDKATVVALREIAEGYTNFDKVDVEEHDIQIHPTHTAASHLTIIDNELDAKELGEDDIAEDDLRIEPHPGSDEHTDLKDEE